MATSEATAGEHLEQSTVSVEFSCPICGGAETDRICSSAEVEAQIEFVREFHRRRLRQATESALQDRVNFTQEYITHIEACRTCGLVCRTPRPSVDAITGAYSDDRYGQEHLESEHRLQRAWAAPKVQALQSRLPNMGSRTPHVVEVGSFVGGFLAAGIDQGWSMMGVDPGKEVASFCRDRGWNVFQGTLVEAPIRRGTVDAVAIWNTFDQLANPDATLGAARQMLTGEGVLVIRVPNGACFRRLWARQKKASEPLKSWVMASMAWNNLLGFPYVYGYTVQTLDQLMARHGFARMEVHPDTLMTLTNDASTAWARCEEKILKSACAVAARVDWAWGDGEYRSAPWFDVYYRVAQSVSNTALSVARIPDALGPLEKAAPKPLHA